MRLERIAPEDIERFVASRRVGKLVAQGADGAERSSLCAFRRAGDFLVVDLPRSHPIVTDLATQPRCRFELDDWLAAPAALSVEGDESSWQRRTVVYDGVAQLTAISRGQIVRLTIVPNARRARFWEAGRRSVDREPTQLGFPLSSPASA